ncbi:MAG: hypothetical protein KGI78_03605 [Patescibacteria group bacterium]|nr:hypothetical protein [Patescibacteria group bacterium]MDE2057912.1 hypothetical protein [Patescibacteria group bacterium]
MNAKSPNHSRITGTFAEYFVLYLLSKRGFECARVDHVGIDLLAKDPASGEMLGVSVKSRSRYAGTEVDPINLHETDIAKAEEACTRFVPAVPHFAFVVDTPDQITLLLLSAKRLRELMPGNGPLHYWKMSSAAIEAYRADSEIEVVEYRRTSA